MKTCRNLIRAQLPGTAMNAATTGAVLTSVHVIVVNMFTLKSSSLSPSTDVAFITSLVVFITSSDALMFRQTESSPQKSVLFQRYPFAPVKV